MGCEFVEVAEVEDDAAADVVLDDEAVLCDDEVVED